MLKKEEISFLPSFLQDLLLTDNQFSGRVMKKLFSSSGKFKSDQEDKPYKGVTNCLERKVSKGDRILYFKEGYKVYLWRCGSHNIHTKQKLVRPKSFRGSSKVEKNAFYQNYFEEKEDDFSELDFGRLFYTSNEQSLSPRIYELFRKYLKLPLKEMTLISPFLSENLFDEGTGFIGGHTRHPRQEGAKLRLITRPPVSEQGLNFLDKLDKKGWTIDWVEGLHSKLFIFKVNINRINTEYIKTADIRDICILGSSNLTNRGLGISGKGNEEITYSIPEQKNEDLFNYLKLVNKNCTTDIEKFRIRTKLLA